MLDWTLGGGACQLESADGSRREDRDGWWWWWWKENHGGVYIGKHEWIFCVFVFTINQVPLWREEEAVYELFRMTIEFETVFFIIISQEVRIPLTVIIPLYIILFFIIIDVLCILSRID